MFTILVAGSDALCSEISKYFSGQKQKVISFEGLEPVEVPPVHFAVLGAHAGPKSGAGAVSPAWIRKLLAVMKKKSPLRLVVYLSSIEVWGNRVTGDVDESTPPDPDSGVGRMALEAEEAVLSSGCPAVIFRLGEVYGPGHNLLAAVRQGTVPWSDDCMMNLIHRADAAAAIRPLFNKAKAGEVYIGVDHEPTLKSEVYRYLAEKTGAGSPSGYREFGGATPKRCRNAKLKGLGFFFRYPSFRVGYDELLGSEPVIYP
jgi:nucleoside-diphosphate-sugar epimerase